MTLLRNDEPFVYPPDRQETLLDENGSATERFYTLLQGLSARIPIYGSGDPNGQFEANKGRLFVNIDGAQGQRIWMKTTNGGRTGWEVA